MADRGQPVQFVWRKWDGSPHWRYSARLLGEDDHGHWFGQRRGTRCTRPGADITTPANTVLLVPASERWVATFYERNPQDGVLIYVDVAARVSWRPTASEVTAIDMDLDVIKSDDTRGTWIDDEDEFADHITTLGYPEAEIGETRRAASSILLAVGEEVAPFDGSHERWLRLDEAGA